jgi:hypothetical protein
MAWALKNDKAIQKKARLQGTNVATSKGVKGHLPFLRLASGFITRPGRWNFPLQLLSRAFSIVLFSFEPSSYLQHEKATMS